MESSAFPNDWIDELLEAGVGFMLFWLMLY